MSEPFYVQLGLVERKYKPRRDRDFSLTPEQGSRFFHLETEEIIDTYEHNRFLEEVINQGQTKKSHGKRIAIIGEPGVGKTTLLEAIAFSPEAPGLPIWISLGSIGEKTLEEYLCQKWLKEALKTSDVTRQQKALEELFKSGEVLLLLDGVDEMPASSPVEALAKIRKELTGWVADARVVLTCRVNVWDANVYALQGFDTYRTLPLEYGDSNKPDQVKQFICQWFSKTDKPKLGESLGKKLDANRHQRIRDLAKNPLLLSLLCQSWYFRQGDLPKTKAALYEQFTRAFYDWKDEKFTTTSTKRKELNEKLALLAREAIDEEKSRFAIRESFALDVMGEDLFNSACKLHWLIHVYNDADTNEKVYAFFHPTFQEYFAACAIENWNYFLNHIADNPPPDGYRIFEPQWKEIFLLWLGRDKQKLINQKEALLKALVTFEDEWENFYHYRAYFLAAAGIKEFHDPSSANGIKDVFQIMYFNEYLQELGFDETISRSIVERAKQLYYSTDANVVVSNLVRLGLHCYKLYISSDWCKTIGSCVAEEARLVLEETDRVRAIALLSWLIQSIQAEALQTYAVEILGKIGTSNETAIKVLEWQTQNVQDEQRQWEAAENLGKIHPTNETARKVLINLVENAQHEQIRSAAAWSLGKIDPGNKIAIKTLIKILQTSQEGYSRKRVASSLGEIDPGNEEAKAWLLTIRHTTQDKTIRLTVADSLGRVDPGNKIAIKDLEKMTQDESICQSAAESLGEIDPGNIIAIRTLEKLINNAPPDHEFYRQFVASYLAKVNFGNQIAIESFKLIIKRTKDELILCRAAMSLGQMDYNNETNRIATDALVRYIQTAKYNSTVYGFAEIFKPILRSEQNKKVVRSLKSYLINPSYENGDRNEMDRFFDCYTILWYCAQNMSYPAFHQAWCE